MEQRDNSIFIIEKDLFYTELMLHVLHQEGFSQVETFSTSSACIDNLYKSPDIVIIDYNIESGRGVEVLHQIKAISPDVQVIFISGQETASVALDALKLGAFDYIMRDSFAMERLVRIIHNITDLKEVSERKQKRQQGLNGALTFTMSILLLLVMAVLLSH